MVLQKQFMLCATGLALLASQAPAQEQRDGREKAMSRRFIAGTAEHYRVSLSLRAESHSVATQTVAAQTYVAPVTHEAEVRMRWNVTRKVEAVKADGSAAVSESLEILGGCDAPAQAPERLDEAMQKGLDEFCAGWLKEGAASYVESPRGAMSGLPRSAPALGETSPPLLSLWLVRAVRPNALFPTLHVQPGEKSQRTLHPTDAALPDAEGSESTEWVDAPGDAPAVTLHVVQRLSWRETAKPSDVTPREASFFADSLTTVSLLDGSVQRASRSASRETSHKVDPVPGLPDPPDFSTKLTATIAIERLP